MIDKVLGLLSPHICKACGERGATLCKRCVFDIGGQAYDRCLLCQAITESNNLCVNCRGKTPFNRAFVVGDRRGALKRLVGDFKFNSERASADVIAELLDLRLPHLPGSTVVVPIPTIGRHIRQRGFDHMALVARRLAKRRGLRCDLSWLGRSDSSVQHGRTAKERRQQAKKAFNLKSRRALPNEVLLIDDIFTTGATTQAAGRLLRRAGVKIINLGIVARQTK
jgi:ComF family protein